MTSFSVLTSFSCSPLTVTADTGQGVAVWMNVFVGLEGAFPVKSLIGISFPRWGDGALFNALRIVEIKSCRSFWFISSSDRIERSILRSSIPVLKANCLVAVWAVRMHKMMPWPQSLRKQPQRLSFKMRVTIRRRYFWNAKVYTLAHDGLPRGLYCSVGTNIEPIIPRMLITKHQHMLLAGKTRESFSIVKRK